MLASRHLQALGLHALLQVIQDTLFVLILLKLFSTRSAVSTLTVSYMPRVLCQLARDPILLIGHTVN